MTVSPGARLSHYEIVSLIGSGGMGEVYRARDVRLDRTVAVKVLPAYAHAQPALRQRFEREARAVARFNHPHVCALYDIGSEDGVDFLVMEYLEGETLADRLRRGALPLDLVLRVSIEIADALDHAYRAGIIHRDLKPSNVMLTASGAKLLDFGLAKLRPPLTAGDVGTDMPTDPQSPSDLTAVGAVLGTFQYMSPEQLEGRVVDARSDLFTFGAMVHEMATGQKAFQAASHASLIAAILNSQPPPISTYQATASSAFDRLVQKCLAKSPDERWQTARDLLDELKWIAGQSSTFERDINARSLVPPRFALTPVWRAALGTIAALLLVGFAVRLWLNPAGPAREVTAQRLVTDSPGAWGFPRLSPDGGMIAFTGSAPGPIPNQLFVKNLAGGEPIQLTFGESRVARLAWSPKGDEIVFSRVTQGIWSIPPLGGVPRRLIDQGNRPSFSADGRRLAFQRGREIWIANSDSTQAQRVVQMPSAEGGYPALSPDGHWIAFFQTASAPAGDLWVIPSAGGAARRVTFDERAGGAPVWMPDSRSIILPSTRRGSMTLWQFPFQGGAPTPLTFGAGEDLDPDISSDGRRLVYVNVRRSYGLLVTNPITKGEREVLARQGSFFGAVFSPTGDRIAFFQEHETGVHLFTVRTDGTDLRQITRTEGEVNVFPQWSGDGASLYFFQEKPAVSFRRVAVAGGQSIEVRPWSLQSGASVDSDGRRAVVRRAEGDRTVATIVHELATGEEAPLPVVLETMTWSRDGRTLYGLNVTPNDGEPTWKLMACAVPGPCRTLTDGRGSWSRVAPSGDDSMVVFLRPVAGEPTQREVWSIDRDGKNESRIGRLGEFVITQVHFDVSPHADLGVLTPRSLDS